MILVDQSLLERGRGGRDLSADATPGDPCHTWEYALGGVQGSLGFRGSGFRCLFSQVSQFHAQKLGAPS